MPPRPSERHEQKRTNQLANLGWSAIMLGKLQGGTTCIHSRRLSREKMSKSRILKVVVELLLKQTEEIISQEKEFIYPVQIYLCAYNVKY